MQARVCVGARVRTRHGFFSKFHWFARCILRRSIARSISFRPLAVLVILVGPFVPLCAGGRACVRVRRTYAEDDPFRGYINRRNSRLLRHSSSQVSFGSPRSSLPLRRFESSFSRPEIARRSVPFPSILSFSFLGFLRQFFGGRVDSRVARGEIDAIATETNVSRCTEKKRIVLP